MVPTVWVQSTPAERKLVPMPDALIHLTRSSATRFRADPAANPGGHAGVTVRSRTRLMMVRSPASPGAEESSGAAGAGPCRMS